jgi:hypothetical protein
MRIEFLRKFEGRDVKVILRNNFVYSNIVFSITQEQLIKFKNRNGEVLTIEPSYISAITEKGLGDENGN